jgi:hypothetical protein
MHYWEKSGGGFGIWTGEEKIMYGRAVVVLGNIRKSIGEGKRTYIYTKEKELEIWRNLRKGRKRRKGSRKTEGFGGKGRGEGVGEKERTGVGWEKGIGGEWGWICFPSPNQIRSLVGCYNSIQERGFGPELLH